MKINGYLKAALLAAIGLALSVAPGRAQSVTYTNSFDTSASVASWIYWYGVDFNNTPVLWSSTEDDTPAVPGSGSMEISIPWNMGGQYDQAVIFGTFDNQYGYDFTETINATTYTNITFDVHVDPTSPTNQNGNFGNLTVGFITPQDSQITWPASTVALPLAATNGWYHYVIPIDITQPNLNMAGGIVLSMNTYSGGSLQASPTPTHFWVDNLQVVAATVPVAPPTLLTPTIPVQGLNFVSSAADGGVNGRIDVQTVNNTGNGWLGASGPVTYSTTISAFPSGALYAGYQAQIFLTTGNPPSYETAPDYNETNLIDLEIHQNGDGQTAYASLRYKVNEPDSNANVYGTDNGTAGTLVTLNAPSIIGTWSITFTDNTNITIDGPGGSTTNCTLTAAAAANFTEPINVYFGSQPNSAGSYGQTVVMSSVSTTGTTTPLSDNFLTDSTLNTNLFMPITGDNSTIFVVPSGSAYWLAWTLPDTAFSLESTTSLQKPITWKGVTGLASFTTAGQRRVLLAKTNLPSASEGFFNLIQRSFSQLQILLPGETAAPGTPTGKTGTPTSYPFNGGLVSVPVTVNAVDSQWNIISSVSDVVDLTSTDSSGVDPNPAALANGTAQIIVYFGQAGTFTISGVDASDATKTNTSSPITITP
jgi:hypothetical protein